MTDFPKVAGASFSFQSVYDGHGAMDYVAVVWWGVTGSFEYSLDHIMETNEGFRKVFQGRDGEKVFNEAWAKYLAVK